MSQSSRVATCSGKLNIEVSVYKQPLIPTKVARTATIHACIRMYAYFMPSEDLLYLPKGNQGLCGRPKRLRA